MLRRLYQYFLSIGNLDGFISYVSYIVVHGVWVFQPCLVPRDKTFSYVFVIQDHRSVMKICTLFEVLSLIAKDNCDHLSQRGTPNMDWG